MAAHPVLSAVDADVFVPTHLSLGTMNEWGRNGGHFGLDATLTDPQNVWNQLLFVARHEAAPLPDRVQYAAWELHSVKAIRRMLVAYFGRSTSIKTFEDLEKLVREVCSAHVGQDLLLVGGDCDAKPTSPAELCAAHQTAIVGVVR